MNSYQKKYIIFDAIAFCFGPISSTLNLVKELKSRLPSNYEVIFIGNGTSYQLAKKSQLFNQLISCNTLSLAELNLKLDLFKKATLFISNTNAFSAEFASKRKIPTIYIDTLFWMWDKLSNDFTKVLTYYIEDFHCTDYKIDKFRSKISNPKIVAPLIEMQQISKKPINPNLLLVNLGGIDSDFTKPPKLYQLLLEWFMEIPMLKNKQIVIAGGGKTILNLKKLLKKQNSNVEINCYSQNDYINLLGTARKVISSPGVHSFYETFFHNKDVFFLLPQNYSQYLQLKYISKNFPQVKSCHQLMLDESFSISPNLSEEEGIKKLDEINQRILSSDQYIKQFFTILENFLNFDNISSKWQKSFPYKKSGAIEIAEDILNSYIKQEVSHV